MKCKRIQEMMGAYLYGDLAPDELREVRLHTQDCAACREDVESRGKVLAAIPSAAPELSDDERMQIAWGVKGAIRNGAQAREGFRWGYVAAVATVALAGLAVAAIVVYNSSRPPPSMRAQQKPVGPVVSIQEERKALPRKPKTVPQVQAEGPAAPTEDHERPALGDRAANIARQLVHPATTARKDLHKRKIMVDKPAPVVEQPQLNEPAPPKEGEKLPKPTDPNDAQTAP